EGDHMRTRCIRMSIVAAASLCLLATTVLAQFPPITDPHAAEGKCETGTDKALMKYMGSKAKRGAKCLATARKVGSPYGQCFAPYADMATRIYDPLKVAHAKAVASLVKSCSVDCPECYTSQSASLCSTGDPLLSTSDSRQGLHDGRGQPVVLRA